MNDAIIDIIEDIFGAIRKINRDKGQLAVDCPACAEDKGIPGGDGKGNLEVNYKKGVFKCWACAQQNNMSGGIKYLISRYGNPKHLREFQIFAPDYNINQVKDDDTIKVMSELPKEFIPLTEEQPYDIDYNKAIKYLKKRRVTDDIIKKHNIGFIRDGKYAGRVIIPSHSNIDTVNYFIGRSYGKAKPKYLNPDIEKQTIIFNEKLINWDGTIYLLEGAFDHIVVPNSIPLLGKYMYDLLFKMLMDKAMGYVVIVLDGDAENDAKELYRLLNIGRLRNRIKIVILPEDLDISLINEKYGSNGVLHYLKTARKIKESEL